MSILNQIITTQLEAPRITLYGIPGVGKTTLANSFPDPLFFMIEKMGLEGLRALPLVEDFSAAWKNINALYAEPELPFKTLVIDSVSELDKLIIKYVLQTDPKRAKAIEEIKFGQGYGRVSQTHRGFKEICDKFTQRGVTVIYICHEAIAKVKRPDDEEYDRYSIQMNHDKSREHYVNNVDAVLFCRQKSYTDTTESGRTIVRSTEERVIIGGLNAGNVSKNRFGLPNELPMSFEALKPYLKFYGE